MAALLKDKDGNLRSKEDFKTEALKVDETYNTTHLDTEYDTAVRTARLAAQWQKFEKNKKLYPNLKYLLTKASKPDEKHLQYVGIIAPVDSIFWSTHYPPNRWRCQCGVEQTDEDATDIPHDLPPVDPEFAFNAGKTGQIFDVEKSSYIKSVPAKEQPALIKQATSFVNKEAAISAPYQTIYKSKSGTSVEAHPLAFDAPDYAESFKLARDLANSKLPVNTIQILPYLHTKKELKHKLLPDAKKDYDPDYRIDGVLVDGKQPSGKTASKNTIKNIISHAHDQANGVIIKIDKSNYIIDEQLYADIDNKFRNKAYDDFVLYLKYNDEWRMWNKEQWNEFYKAIKKP